VHVHQKKQLKKTRVNLKQANALDARKLKISALVNNFFKRLANIIISASLLFLSFKSTVF
jgi:hypothetical protein